MSFRFLILIVIFEFIFSFGVSSQNTKKNYNLRYYTTNQGLSNNTVKAVLQDYMGYLWIATQDGLNRFDGNTFKIYRSKPGDQTSISNNNINCLYEDHEKVLWIGTRGGGLSKYNRGNDDFTNFEFDSNNSASISHREVFTIFEDADRILWIGTDGGGLNKFDREKRTFTRFMNDAGPRNTICSNKILSINDDDQGNLLLGTWDGSICKFNKKTGHCTQISIRGSVNGPFDEKVWIIKKDKPKGYWVGQFEGGMHYFSAQTTKFRSFDFSSNKEIRNSTIYSFLRISDRELWIGGATGLYLASISYKNEIPEIIEPLMRFTESSVANIYKDRSGSIWVSNYQNGLIQINPKNPQFTFHPFELKKVTNINLNSSILCFSDFSDKEILVGTYTGALKYNLVNEQISFFEKSPESDLARRRILKFVSDSTGLWASRNFDIAHLNPKTNRFDSFFSLSKDINQFGRDGYTDLIFDAGTIWAATQNGLYQIDSRTKQVKTIINNRATRNGFNVFSIQSIAYDGKESVYIGTIGGGLVVYNKLTETLTYYQYDPGNPSSIASNVINQIYLSKNGKIWLLTFNGLDEFDKDQKKFKHFNTTNGFPSSILNAVIEDNNENLWISSNNAISRFNLKTHHIWNHYFFDQGIQGPFYAKSVYKSPKGNLYFGRSGSFISFNPDSIKQNNIPPDILITDFKINNQPIKVSNEGPLYKQIEDADEIRLKYNQSSFSFSFAAMNFIFPERNQYAYMLENFDREWIYCDNLPFANYTNIPPGKYIFRVKASNQDGIWNEKGISLHIQVDKPFWETWWFRMGIFGLVVVLFIIWYINHSVKVKQEQIRLEKLVEIRTRQLSETNSLLEEQKEEIEQQKEELISQRDELTSNRENLEVMVLERTKDLEEAIRRAEESDKLKTSFLSNMSHEIRTPLNAIVGFSSLLNSDELSNEKREQYASIIQSNSDALLILIDDVLDLSKIEAGQVVSKPSRFAIKDFLVDMLETFSQNHHFSEVQIRLNDIATNNYYSLFTDHVRLRQILNNLLSNALKFTEKGYIELGIFHPKKQQIRFYVKDTGIGISQEFHQTIFERFRKVESQWDKLYGGTGLGLAICYRLTELLHGKIWVESEFGKGSTFYLELPYNDSVIEEFDVKPVSEFNFTSSNSVKKLLIVEDIEYNYIYIKELLNDILSEILWAKNGNEAIVLAKENPDLSLILMDIKLPGMSGTDAFKVIRSFNSSIPIIAQTAFALNEERDELLNVGFTDYIAKPIKKQVLFDKLNKYLF